MEKDSLQKNFPSKYYSVNEFMKDLKKPSIKEDLDYKAINTFKSINSSEVDTSKKENQTPLNYKSEMRYQLNEKLKLINQPPGGYVNEVMKSELKILSKENAELKFCLNNLNKKFEKEIKDLKLQNSNKSKEIQSTKEIIKKNTALIELLGGKIMNYEKIFKDIESKNQKKTVIDKNIQKKLLQAQKENIELKKDISERDEIIKSFKDEIESKKEIFEEIDKMKNEMEAYLKTMDKLYVEIENKDKEITELKNNMESMEKKHKQDIENILNNKDINLNDFQMSSANNDQLLNELSQSKEKQIQLTKDLIDVQKKYEEAKNYNMKMQKITKEASDMIKKSIDARDKMKGEYDKAIKDLVQKYEKQIQFMKLVIVEQNEKFEKQLEDLKNDKKKEKNEDKSNENKDTNDNNIDSKNNKNDKEKDNGDDEEAKNKYLEKLKKDNKILIEQNTELKNMNEMLLSKMEDLPNLNNKFNELFDMLTSLKEENDLLKKGMKDKGMLKMLGMDQEEKEKENKEKDKEEMNNKESDENDKENENEEELPKLSLEELEMLETLIKDVENNNGGDKEENQKKLELLEMLLKKLENKNGEEEKEEEEDNKEGEENHNEKENEENEEDKDIDMKRQFLLNELLKNLGEGMDVNDDNEKIKKEENKQDINKDLPLKIPNKEKEEINKDKKNDINIPNKIYNKKLLKISPKIKIASQAKTKDKDKKDDNENNENKEKIKTEGDNEEEENEEEEEDNIPNQINENFNLFKPTKDGILSFSLSKKNYSTMVPNKFDEFLKVFDPDTSVQYNTLEGLFIIPSNKCNQLYYYSSKKNTIAELFLLKENHSGGCLFLDNISKNIIALGGYESKAVEKFSFESGKLEQLPELSTHRSKITCNQIGNKIYCFFGISKEKPNQSLVEFLDLENIEEGWKEVEFENNVEFNVISGMSCINLNDNELLIIGGLINDEVPNEQLLYFNIENKKLIKLDKNLPDSEEKVYLFTQNTMFNLFVNGDIISFANIDNNNQVHILDNDLCYDLYLTPKIK
jgi:hypothetical protein